MGNCGASQRAVESWADDGEWEEGVASSEEEDDHRERREHLSEVTIRITRRQLHELVDGKASGHGKIRRSTQQLLVDIMNSGEVHHHDHHRDEAHWKPALQSIPEAVES